jgi:VIT1/CCC1 family predicted Fe2+/Mn2+ transporter
MDAEERQAAVFGAFDGVVSVIGFVFGLMVHHSPEAAIAIGGLGGAISATISMGTGQFESTEGAWHKRLVNALFMALFTLGGSLMPVWPFFVFSKPVAITVAAFCCLAVAGWIGYEKRKGVVGFVIAYATLLAAAGFALLVVSRIPSSA